MAEQSDKGPPVEFSCKEQGCQFKVRYERITHPGGLGALLRKKSPSGAAATVGAYLVCPDGHVHRYEIPPSPEGTR